MCRSQSVSYVVSPDMRLTQRAASPIHPPPVPAVARGAFLFDDPDARYDAMKVRSSLKSLKGRHRDCKLVRRKGRIYVINKTDPRFKARQG